MLSRGEAGPRAPGGAPARDSLERLASHARGRGALERPRSPPRARALRGRGQDVQARAAGLRARAPGALPPRQRAPLRLVERGGRAGREGVRLPRGVVQPAGRARGGARPQRRRDRPEPRRAPALEGTKKGGSPTASRPRRWNGVRLPLAEPLPLHVGPELLGHHGRPDRAAAEDLLHRVLAALEADCVPAERLPSLRHVLLLLLMWSGTRLQTSRGYYYYMAEGRKRKNTIPWGSSDVGEIPQWGIGRARGLSLARPERRHHVAREHAGLI